MFEFEIFLKTLLSIAAGIVTIGGAYGVIAHVVERSHRPQEALEKIVNEHEKKLEDDRRRINDLEESNRLIMRGVMNLMSHEMDGNHTDQLRAARDEMEQYLISK